MRARGKLYDFHVLVFCLVGKPAWCVEGGNSTGLVSLCFWQHLEFKGGAFKGKAFHLERLPLGDSFPSGS